MEERDQSKLNIPQTVKIGFAFLSISAFWQLYNGVIPPVLTGTFDLNETWSGVIMALDNVLALFLLPLFGMLSDRCKSPLGRRKPFILFGTIAAVVLMQMIPFLDNRYAASGSAGFRIAFIVILLLLLVAMGTYRSPAVALMPDMTPKHLRSKGNAVINLMGALGAIIYLIVTALLYSGTLFTDEKGHTDYTLLFVIVAALMVLALLVIMLTVKEPVAEANTSPVSTEGADTLPLRGGQEPEEKGEVAALQAPADAEKQPPEKRRLPKDVRKSLIFLLFSIAFWFISYNAVETWFTTFANRAWGMTLGNASLCLTITTIGMIAAFIPAALIASKIGRRKTILSGLIAEVVTFFGALMYTVFADRTQMLAYLEPFLKEAIAEKGILGILDVPQVSSVLYGSYPGEAAVYADGAPNPAVFGLFFLMGVAWALINVNSLPMVVDMCADADVGKYTGYYYTFSMAAQVITPVLSGWLLDRAGYFSLFLYAACFMGIACFTVQFVRHGDTVKTPRKKGLEAYEDL